MNQTHTRRNAIPRRTCQYRNGSALLVVLTLLAITLAVSFAMVRSQVSSVQVQANHNRQADARNAAMTGIAVGLRRMHDSDWGGITETPSGQLEDNVFYFVEYQTGDQSLDSSDPNYALYPYRVTVTATGQATDPGDSNVVSTHRLQVVVQLVPRKLSPAVADWSEASPYTFYQWKTTSSSKAEIELPVRLEGNVRFQSTVALCDRAPNDAPARERLLADLLARYKQVGEDELPFSGTVDLPFSETDQETRDLMSSELGLVLNDVAADNDFEPEHPSGYDQYQLYPGGQVYDIETVFFWLSNLTLAPDPESNPLGLFRSSGAVFLWDDVSIQGSLLVGGSSDDLRVEGHNVTWSSHTLPLTLDDGIPIELPTAYVGDDLKIDDTSQATLTGVFSAGDDFEVISGSQNDVSCQLEGQLICKDLKVRTRDEWEQLDIWWQLRLSEFLAQLDNPASSVDYFQQWLEQIHGLDPQPRIVIKPRTEVVNVHWMNFDNPLFVPHDDDEGLMWEIVDWKEAE